MKRLLIASLFVFLITVASCGGNRVLKNIEKPEWLNGKHSQYSGKSYLTGTGTYKYLKRAKQVAREEISNHFFKVTLEEDTSYFLGSSRTFTTISEKLLNSIQVVELWENPVTSNYHVFAILPRRQAAEFLKQEISKLDDSTRTIIEKTTIARDKLDKIIFARKAIDTQIERIAYLQALKRVDPKAKNITQIWQISRLGTDFRKLLSRVRIKPLVTNDNTMMLNNSLTKGIKWSGMTVDNASSADFTLEASLSFGQYNEKKAEGYRTTGKLKINLIDRSRNKLGNKTWPIAILSPSQKETDDIIGEEMIKIFKSDLQATLLKFASKP